MKEPAMMLLTFLIYLLWLSFLVWMVQYFDSAWPLLLLIFSPRVKYIND